MALPEVVGTVDLEAAVAAAVPADVAVAAVAVRVAEVVAAATVANPAGESCSGPPLRSAPSFRELSRDRLAPQRARGLA